MAAEGDYVPPGTDSPADIARVQEFIRSQVQEYLQQTTPAAPQQQPVHTSETDAHRVLGETLAPFINPALNSARLTAADAKDYVDFYNDNPVAREYKSEVEQIFSQQVQQGINPLPRREILRWVRGKAYEEDQDKFRQRESTHSRAALERADSAMDLGAGTLSKAKADQSLSDLSKMSTDDMAKALEGLTF